MSSAARSRRSPIDEEADRWLEEAADLKVFIDRCCYIPLQLGGWTKVSLWPSQRPVIDTFRDNSHVIVLKARQLGLTWLAVFEALHTMKLNEGVQIGVYSLREAEAVDLVRRMKNVDRRLPRRWQTGQHLADSGTYWQLGNGSSVRALSSETGDSYSFGMVIVDEADLVPDLGNLLRSAAPTTDRGGRMRLISRSDKTRPLTEFKAIWRAARDGTSKYKGIFLPWSAAPDRDEAWYKRQVAEELSKGKTIDYVREQYPSTPAEALAPSEEDKRFPLEWVELRTAVRPRVDPRSCPPIPSLRVYHLPQREVRYAIGGDPAEGNPTSDPSAAVILDQNGVQVAAVDTKTQPHIFGMNLAQLSRWYNGASVLVERNNHGHAVLVVLEQEGVDILIGPDGKPGWLQNQRSKARMYDDLAEAIQGSELTIRDEKTSDELQSIHGTDLCAPEGLHDDLATAIALAWEGVLGTHVTSRPGRFTPERPPPVNPAGPRVEKTYPTHWRK